MTLKSSKSFRQLYNEDLQWVVSVQYDFTNSSEMLHFAALKVYVFRSLPSAIRLHSLSIHSVWIPSHIRCTGPDLASLHTAWVILLIHPQEPAVSLCLLHTAASFSSVIVSKVRVLFPVDGHWTFGWHGAAESHPRVTLYWAVAIFQLICPHYKKAAVTSLGNFCPASLGSLPQASNSSSPFSSSRTSLSLQIPLKHVHLRVGVIRDRCRVRQHPKVYQSLVHVLRKKHYPHVQDDVLHKKGIVEDQDVHKEQAQIKHIW